LPHMIAQYHTLRARGCGVQLIIGPWTHGRPGALPWVVRESLGWLQAHLLGDDSQVRTSPVLVFQMGADRWLEYAEWPPPYRRERWHLQADRGLSTAGPRASTPDHYRYDPRDPTPTVGGTSPMLGGGRADQRPLEARPDVLTYTSAPLIDALDIVGPVSADLFVRPSSPHTDLFARLCERCDSRSPVAHTRSIRATRGAASRSARPPRSRQWTRACTTTPSILRP
ncbi:MAG: CocE/NonD family hydrolase, partial [Thermoleophilia bacterium]|nr:CocE/NonD family hydrolase [Thermoleophilia bacterium]